jgi:hypothetical protein
MGRQDPPQISLLDVRFDLEQRRRHIYKAKAQQRNTGTSTKQKRTPEPRGGRYEGNGQSAIRENGVPSDGKGNCKPAIPMTESDSSRSSPTSSLQVLPET